MDSSLDELPDTIHLSSGLTSCFSSKISKQLNTTGNLNTNTQYQFIPKRRKRGANMKGNSSHLNNYSQRTPSPLSPSLDDDDDHEDDASTTSIDLSPGTSSPPPLLLRHDHEDSQCISNLLLDSPSASLVNTISSSSHPQQPTSALSNLNTYPPSSSSNILSTKRLANNANNAAGYTQQNTNKQETTEWDQLHVTIHGEDAPDQSSEKKIKYPSIFRFVKTTPFEESENVSSSLPSTLITSYNLHSHNHQSPMFNAEEDVALTRNDSALHTHRKEVLARKRASLDCPGAAVPASTTPIQEDPHLVKIKDEIHMRRSNKRAQQQVALENSAEHRSSPIPHSEHSMIIEFRKNKLERQLSNNQVVGCKN
ncbi:hypothetical protein C9374_001544 [Naegleria lovaniensis]|uniref:Uncharacterized protein n=1 Tax=Naegleria lovaniensis TaxID=51637 RepID=A0AA88GUE1_NAELO|nr:uncharacterized protein C9374_001544 [Naegleria lovaniensis]KAG2387212.1 hypothetical protein C9374_001544 [Naegleria lovaniensis]